MGRFCSVLLFFLRLSLVVTMGAAPFPGPALAEVGEHLQWLDRDGEPLPFTGHEEARSFLRKARVVEKKELTAGTNRPWKVMLELDGIRAHAIFRTVDLKRQRVKIGGKIYVSFHDSALHECAAYELSRMLGIENIPPCVRRRLEGTSGTLQLWIEQAVTELERREQNAEMPPSIEFARDRQTMRLFDALIANIDRNLGNLLIDSANRLWFIDHTRTFGVDTEVDDLTKIVWCDRRVWEALRTLDKKELNRRLGPFIEGRRILALLERREKVMEHVENRIAELGAGSVLFDDATVLDSLAGFEEATAELDLPSHTSLPLIDG